MKSRTSCCKAVLLKKDLTRFFPAWALYCVGLLMLFIMSIYSETNLYERAGNLCAMMQIFVIINFGYALLNAQLLFGDLFNARMTNALHALPVKRDTFFWAHIAAGLLVSLIPNAAAALIVMPGLGSWAAYSWLWFASAFLSYFFFFTLAVLCTMLTGNRLGQVLLYGIINFFAILVCWYQTEVYSVLLYGVWLDESYAIQLCPPYALASKILCQAIAQEFSRYPDVILEDIRILDWTVPLIYGAVGVVLLGASQVLYRLRRLECAGDLLAFSKLKGFFLVTFTLTAGAGSQLFSQLITSRDLVGLPFAMLLVGMAVGYIAGLMLLNRQMQVFRLKNFKTLAAVLAVLMVTVGLTALDPLGIESRVPEVDQVAGIQVGDESNGNYYNRPSIPMTDKDSIETAIALQKALIENHNLQFQNSKVWGLLGIYHGSNQGTLAMHYTLKNGKTLNRYYSMDAFCSSHNRLDMNAPEVIAAMKLLSTPETVLGIHEDEVEDFAASLETITFYLNENHVSGVPNTYIITKQQDKADFLRAYIGDCREGVTAQSWFYHNSADVEDDYIGYAYCQKPEKSREKSVNLELFANNPCITEWINANIDHLDIAPKG